MSAWLWLAVLLVILLAAGAAALSSPIELRAFATYPSQAPLRLNVRWLFGLVDVDVEKTPGSPEASDDGAEGAEPVRADDEAAAQPTGVQIQAPEDEPEGGFAVEVGQGSPSDEAGDEPPEDEDDPLDRVEGALDSGVSYLEERKDVRRKVDVALAVLRTEDFLLVTMRLLRDLVGAVDVDRIGIRAGFGLGSPAETGKVFGQLQAAIAWTHATPNIRVELDPDFYTTDLHGGADIGLRARTWNLLRPIIVFALAPATMKAIRNAREAGR